MIRVLEVIKFDNGGGKVEVVIGRIYLRDISFEMFVWKFDILKGMVYGRILRKYWKVYKIYDFDEILRRVKVEEFLMCESIYESFKSIFDEIRVDLFYLKGLVFKLKVE